MATPDSTHHQYKDMSTLEHYDDPTTHLNCYISDCVADLECVSDVYTADR